MLRWIGHIDRMIEWGLTNGRYLGKRQTLLEMPGHGGDTIEEHIPTRIFFRYVWCFLMDERSRSKSSICIKMAAGRVQ